MTDKINRPKPKKELLVNDHVKIIFSRHRWRHFCSVKNCKTYAQKDRQCYRHFTEHIEWQKLTESIGTIQNNRRYTGCKWLRLCSVKNCEKYAQKDGQCHWHFKANIKCQQSTKSIGTIHNNRRYNGCRWKRLCSVHNCEKYALKHGLCRRHSRQSDNLPESTENTTISHHSAILKDPTRNHSKHNTSDGYRKFFCSLNFMLLNSSSIVIWS